MKNYNFNYRILNKIFLKREAIQTLKFDKHMVPGTRFQTNLSANGIVHNWYALIFDSQFPRLGGSAWERKQLPLFDRKRMISVKFLNFVLRFISSLLTTFLILKCPEFYRYNLGVISLPIFFHIEFFSRSKYRMCKFVLSFFVLLLSPVHETN